MNRPRGADMEGRAGAPWRPIRDPAPAGWLPPSPIHGLAALPGRLAGLATTFPSTSACCPHRTLGSCVSKCKIPKLGFLSHHEPCLELCVCH